MSYIWRSLHKNNFGFGYDIVYNYIFPISTWELGGSGEETTTQVVEVTTPSQSTTPTTTEIVTVPEVTTTAGIVATKVKYILLLTSFNILFFETGGPGIEVTPPSEETTASIFETTLGGKADASWCPHFYMHFKIGLFSKIWADPAKKRLQIVKKQRL